MGYVKYAKDGRISLAIADGVVQDIGRYGYSKIGEINTSGYLTDFNTILQQELEEQANSYPYDVGFFGIFTANDDIKKAGTYAVNNSDHTLDGVVGESGKTVEDFSYYFRGGSYLIPPRQGSINPYVNLYAAGVTGGGLIFNNVTSNTFEEFMNDPYYTDLLRAWKNVPWFDSIDHAMDYINHGDIDRAINADLFKDKSTALLNVVINFEHTTFEMRLSDLGELDSTEQKVKNANMIITGDNGGTFSKVVSMGDFETFSVSDLRNGGISTSDLKNNNFKVSAVFTDINDNSVSVTPIAPAEPQATSESTLGSNKVVLTLRSSGTVSGDRDNDNSSDSDVDLNTLDDLDAQNILTTTYQMTKAELESFGGLLWDLDLETVGYRFINDNPIENVVSLKMIPFNSGVGDEKNIKLGNVDMGISANTAAKLTKKIFSGKYGKHFTIVNPLKNSTYEFLSYGSNAHLSIHLPFFGVVDLASELIGCEMAVQYVVDFINGECSVFLTRINKINDTDGKEIVQDMHQLIYSATTNIGYEIPLFATNRAAKEQAIADTTDANKIAAVKAVGGVISGTAGALASKNPISMMGTAMEFMTSEKTRELTLRQAQEIGMSVSQKGSTGGVTAINQPTDIYYTVTYPNYYEPAEFEKKNGRPCMKNVKISELETTDQGFHKMHKSLKVTGINAPEDIKQDIYNILTSGFYF